MNLAGYRYWKVLPDFETTVPNNTPNYLFSLVLIDEINEKSYDFLSMQNCIKDIREVRNKFYSTLYTTFRFKHFFSV